MELTSTIRALACGVALALLGAGATMAAPPASAVNESEFRVSGAALPSGVIQPDYLLGPFDKISITVFGQKDLSVEKAQIDAGGNIVLPLVGLMSAGGKTASQFSSDVEKLLGQKYLVSPHVSVLIDEALSQRVTVSGSVVEPGVFNLKGRTTLMQAVAMAKGPDNKTANLKRVAVFRQVDGRNARAIFDLKGIEAGQSPDPEVLGGDSIIVEGSSSKSFWHELVAALPAFGVFSYF